MKIALCLRGLATGTSKSNSKVMGFLGWQSIVKNVCQGHDFDVFCHSWSTSVSDKIIETYKPKKYKFEDQIIFSDTYEKGMEKKPDAKIKKNVWAEQLIRSQMYSLSESIKLKSDYEKENNFLYDAVIILRYDIHFWEKVDYNYLLEHDKKITYSRHPGRASNIESSKKCKWWSGIKIWDVWWGGTSLAIDTLIQSYDFSYKDEATSGSMHKAHQKKLRSVHMFYDDFFKYVNYNPAHVVPHPNYICDLNRIDPKNAISNGLI